MSRVVVQPAKTPFAAKTITSVNRIPFVILPTPSTAAADIMLEDALMRLLLIQPAPEPVVIHLLISLFIYKAYTLSDISHLRRRLQHVI